MTRQKQFEYLQAIQTGHKGAIAGNPNDATALNAYQRLTVNKEVAEAIVQQCATRITLKGASNGR